MTQADQKKLLRHFLRHFNFEDDNFIEKFTNQRPVKFVGMKFGQVKLPLLYWDGRELRENFGSILYLTNIIKEDDGATYFITRYNFIENLVKFLTENNFIEMYVLANWEDNHQCGRIVTAKVEQLEEIYKNNFATDIFFWDKESRWMLSFNHFRLGFLAGDKKIIEDFIDFYPGYRKFSNYSRGCNNS